MRKKQSWTIEVNANEDPLSHEAWHVAPINRTMIRNLETIIRGKSAPWVLVGIANSLDEACDGIEKLKKAIQEAKSMKKDQSLDKNS